MILFWYLKKKIHTLKLKLDIVLFKIQEPKDGFWSIFTEIFELKFFKISGQPYWNFNFHSTGDFILPLSVLLSHSFLLSFFTFLSHSLSKIVSLLFFLSSFWSILFSFSHCFEFLNFLYLFSISHFLSQFSHISLLFS